MLREIQKLQYDNKKIKGQILNTQLIQEECCDLCSNPKDDKCWRQRLLESLIKKKDYVLCMEQEDSVNGSDKFTQVMTGTYSQSQTPTWRQQLIQFIKDLGGYYQDEKWTLEYFEEFQTMGLGVNNVNTSKN